MLLLLNQINFLVILSNIYLLYISYQTCIVNIYIYCKCYNIYNFSNKEGIIYIVHVLTSIINVWYFCLDDRLLNYSQSLVYRMKSWKDSPTIILHL